MLENTIRKRLQINLSMLIEMQHVSFNEIGRRTGMTPSTIARIINNDDANPTLESLMILAKYFNLTVGQLIGEKPIEETNKNGIEKFNFPNYVAQFSWEEIINFPPELYLREKTVITQKKVSEKAFALEIAPTNNEVFNRPGLIIVDPAEQAKNDSFVIVAKKSEVPSIKKIIVDGSIFYIKSLIPGLTPVQLTDESSIIGVIIEYNISL